MFWHTKTNAPTNQTKNHWYAKPKTHKTNTNNKNTTSLTNNGKQEMTRDRDGIPIEFYKEFFDWLKKDLQDIFN